MVQGLPAALQVSFSAKEELLGASSGDNCFESLPGLSLMMFKRLDIAFSY